MSFFSATCIIVNAQFLGSFGFVDGNFDQLPTPFKVKETTLLN